MGLQTYSEENTYSQMMCNWETLWEVTTSALVSLNARIIFIHIIGRRHKNNQWYLCDRAIHQLGRKGSSVWAWWSSIWVQVTPATAHIIFFFLVAQGCQLSAVLTTTFINHYMYSYRFNYTRQLMNGLDYTRFLFENEWKEK